MDKNFAQDITWNHRKVSCQIEELRGVDAYPEWAAADRDRRFNLVQVNVNNPSSKYDEESVDIVICVGECPTS